MIVLGRVIAPYGVRGWLKLRTFGDDPAAWREMPQWWLGADAAGDDWQAFVLEGLRQHGAAWVIKLVGIDDRGAAEGLAGRFIGAPREELPSNAADEYYWADLIGLDVVNEQGESLGSIDSLVETGAHQVLVVKDSGRDELIERLLPFIAQVVKGVDVAGGRVVVAWQKDW
ncbi:MAG: 16S rRNA processing protein RimM [Rhodocyclaceae bacterium]|nr:16S rRNA processing protein RimM [Rhodocyclaceae bacterium]